MFELILYSSIFLIVSFLAIWAGVFVGHQLELQPSDIESNNQ